MARKQEYNWLDDPFNDKKSDQQLGGGMGSGMKVALGCGCLLIVAGVIVLLIFVGMNAVDILVNI